MTANEKVEHLTQYLPRVADLSDRKTAEAVAEVWFKALEMSPWDKFEQAKFKEGMDDVSKGNTRSFSEAISEIRSNRNR